MSLLGFKTKLDPNNEQRTKFAQHAGVSRWAYNWGLDICHQAIHERKTAAEQGLPKAKFPSAIDLHNKLNAEVKPELEWFYESSKCSPQQRMFDGGSFPRQHCLALRDLDNAWKRYLKVPGSSAPKRKKKYRNDHFYLDGSICIKDGFIQLPRIGLVRIHEQVPDQKLKAVTIRLILNKN